MAKKVIPLGLVLLGVHLTAVFYSLYWGVRWIDIPIHFSGGVLIGLVFLWLVEMYPGQFKLPGNFWARALLIISFGALMGVVWEFTEFTYDLFVVGHGLRSAQQGVADTMGDLFFDIIGTFTVATFQKLIYNEKD
ncbi:MAG TPA: hypothetical protein VFE87_02260 [Candidatus Paceibacterota bacterium]|nr:hypothetical protein [Candidatus Paceibacterota bacterium]